MFWSPIWTGALGGCLAAVPINHVQEEGTWGEAIRLAVVDNPWAELFSGEAGKDARLSKE